MVARTIVGTVLVASAVLAAGGAETQQGQLVPDIAVEGESGRSIRLRSQVGHVTVIDFWASWCGPCRESIPALDWLYREYQPRGVVVLAINTDARREDGARILKPLSYKMSLLFDPTGAALLAFGVRAMPTSFVVDAEGRIRFTHLGYSSRVVEQYRKEIDLLLSGQ